MGEAKQARALSWPLHSGNCRKKRWIWLLRGVSQEDLSRRKSTSRSYLPREQACHRTYSLRSPQVGYTKYASQSALKEKGRAIYPMFKLALWRSSMLKIKEMRRGVLKKGNA
ncbi:unnamed protein product, partial [Scytosiphon promiscuus]